MTEPHCLCEQCGMTVQQCKERPAKPQKEFDCIYYPMCHWAYELLYCPKKARGDECEDYKPTKERIAELRTKER